MLDVQAALRAAGVPGYRAGFRRGAEERMPEQYAVYSVKRAEEEYWDDAPHAVTLAPALALYSRANPAALAAAVEAAMRAEGFSLIDRAETYDKLADLYAVESRWTGEAAL